MSKLPDFHSVNEAKKPVANHVYHDNGVCPAGRAIPEHERRSGTGGYRLCDDCKKLNTKGL